MLTHIHTQRKLIICAGNIDYIYRQGRYIDENKLKQFLTNLIRFLFVLEVSSTRYSKALSIANSFFIWIAFAKLRQSIRRNYFL